MTRIFGYLFLAILFCSFANIVKCQGPIRQMPLSFSQNFANHSLFCPLQHNDLVICNSHSEEDICICNYGSSSNILEDKTWLCQIPVGERLMGNYITKVVINRKNHFDTDAEIQEELLKILEKYAGISKKNVIFFVMKCVSTDPNLIELYFAVKEPHLKYEKFHLFKDNYYESYAKLHEQQHLEIVSIKLEKNQIFLHTIPSIISETVEQKQITFEEYANYIYAFIFLSALILFIGCWATRDLSKWYKIEEQEKQKVLEMHTFSSTTSTSLLVDP